MPEVYAGELVKAFEVLEISQILARFTGAMVEWLIRFVTTEESEKAIGIPFKLSVL